MVIAFYARYYDIIYVQHEDKYKYGSNHHILRLSNPVKTIKRLNRTKEGLSLIDKIFQFYTATKIHILKREKEKMVEAWKRHSKTYVIRYDQINLAHSDI